MPTALALTCHQARPGSARTRQPEAFGNPFLSDGF
jgi:hypothetical protein